MIGGEKQFQVLVGGDGYMVNLVRCTFFSYGFFSLDFFFCYLCVVGCVKLIKNISYVIDKLDKRNFI